MFAELDHCLCNIFSTYSNYSNYVLLTWNLWNWDKMSDIIKISINFIPVLILEGRSCQHKATYSENRHFGNIYAAYIFGVFNVSYFIYSAVQQYLLLNLQTSIVNVFRPPKQSVTRTGLGPRLVPVENPDSKTTRTRHSDLPLKKAFRIHTSFILGFYLLDMPLL